MRTDLRLEILQVLEECTNAVRTHEFLIGSRSVPLDDSTRGEIAEGLANTARKLENLRKEILISD